MKPADKLLLAFTLFLPLMVAIPGGRLLLPLLAPLTLYRPMVRRVCRDDYTGAWRLGMVWAVLLSSGVVFLTLLLPEVARDGILNGEPYRSEMFGWIATGTGPEVQPAVFLPEHLLHLVAFIALTWASGGYLGLVLGALLVNYMSYFVGSFAAASNAPFWGAIAAWVPWSVVRVMAFVLLGVLFSRPLWGRRIWPFGRPELRLLAMAGVGIFSDVAMKTLLAPSYGRFLRQIIQG